MDSIGLYRYGQNAWAALPTESFFTWLYINGLVQQDGLMEELATYDGFTDIYFNPKKTNNCQGKSSRPSCVTVQIGPNESLMKVEDLISPLPKRIHQDTWVELKEA